MLLNKKPALWALTLVAFFSALNVSAATPAPEQTISTLGGKFSFKLPKSYQASPLPAQAGKHGVSSTATMYADPQTKSVVIVTETVGSDRIDIQDNDPEFLDSTADTYLKLQDSELPDFKLQNVSKLTLQNIGMRQIDGTATQGGGKTLGSTFLAGSGKQVLVIQTISRADDPAGHALLVKQITGAQ